MLWHNLLTSFLGLVTFVLHYLHFESSLWGVLHFAWFHHWNTTNVAIICCFIKLFIVCISKRCHFPVHVLASLTLRHVNICDRFRKIKNTPTKGWVCRPWNTSQELKSFEVPGLVLTVRLKCQGGVFPLFCSVTQQQLRAQWMTWIAAIKARKHHRCDGTCSSDTHNGNKTEKDKIETTKWR